MCTSFRESYVRHSSSSWSLWCMRGLSSRLRLCKRHSDSKQWILLEVVRWSYQTNVHCIQRQSTDNWWFLQLEFNKMLDFVTCFVRGPVAESYLGSLDSTCSQGYEGPLCGVCAQGYFKLFTKCQRCPSLLWIAVQLVIVFALVSLVAFLTLRDRKKEHAQRYVADILLARLKIVVSFYQVTSGTLNAFSYVK